ncbi:divalent metal cation transporter [Roseiconus lacunae]|uniref:divalent metal cation transporter n=1 Tax=Roseiconus lacunae TaxID=2605694 RepID=UPI003090DE68|nr:divalent metal cation transporter [Stieleria sp. HD01]
MSDAVDAPTETISFSRILRAIGPAIIVASVVLGPGSILINSKVGSTFGYGMIWVMLLSTTMMICTVILSAVIGVSYPSTPLVELRQRLGGGFALTAGLSMFLSTSEFQFSNNLAVMAVVEQAGLAFELGTTTSAVIATGVIVLANLGLVYVLYGSARPYKVIERSMMVMVGMMLIGFLVNLIFVKPSVASVVKGMVPGWTERNTSLRRGRRLHASARVGGDDLFGGGGFLSRLCRT